MAQNTTLKCLSLEGNHLSDTACTMLAKNSTLKILNLGSDNFTNEKMIYPFINNTTLQCLDLWGCNLTDKSFQLLAQNTTLNSLCLADTSVDNATLAFFATNSTLRLLDISNSDRFQSAGISSSAYLEEINLKDFFAVNTTLNSLVLKGIKVGTQGLEVLANNTNLTALDMSRTDIGNPGIKLLIQNSNLQNLVLQNHHLGTESAQALAASPNLRGLTFDNYKMQIKISKYSVKINLRSIGKSQKDIEESIKVIQAFSETNPTTRHNGGIRVGVQFPVPSLLRLSLFAVKSNPFSAQHVELLPDELKSMLARQRI